MNKISKHQKPIPDIPNEPDTKFNNESPTNAGGRIKWRNQCFSEKVETIFHLVGTKEGWAKIRADFADGNFDGRIDHRVSIFDREIDDTERIDDSEKRIERAERIDDTEKRIEHTERIDFEY